MTAAVGTTGEPTLALEHAQASASSKEPARRVAPPVLRRVRPQAIAIGSLVALSLLVYGLPAVLGHPVVPGDDLTQNLPLRELVGRDLRAGTLPLFDPYIWSGAPLLAGWNAGAAYPLTWLFAVLGGSAAWTVNLVAAAVCASVGLYAFLRASGLAVLASWAGAVSFGFAGGMVAQVSHIGLVVGMSWVPLALLGLLRLTDPGASMTAGSRLRWTALLAMAVGMVALSGEPRAVSDGAVVLGLYAAWRVVRLLRVSRRAGGAAAAAVLSGAAIGLGLGAVQLVPGLAAVATSQRAHTSAFLFGAGSLPARWLMLLGVPDLLGGSGSFGQPVFFARYNLTEVTGYVGLLPLVAAVALFARLRRDDRRSDWLVWELVALVGVALALGNNIPLWHLLIHVPLLGGQRLQSRAILVTDLALATLLAYWLDGWVKSTRRASTPAEGPARSAQRVGRAERALGALPLLGVAGVVVTALVDGAALLRWMGVEASAVGRAGALEPWLVVALTLAAGGFVLVVAGVHLPSQVRGVLAASFVLVDLLVFSVTAVVAVGGHGGPHPLAPSHRGTRGAQEAGAPPGPRPIAAMDLSGRFAVYDPEQLYPSQLTALGVPDANTLAGTWSVEGYGSIVNAQYATATGVHGVSGTGQDVFLPRAAADGVLDSLSTQAVLAPSQYFRTPVRTSDGSSGGQAGPPPARARRLAPGRTATWFLGGPLVVRSARVDVRAPAPSGRAHANFVLHVGLLTAGGAVHWAQMKAPRPGATRAQAATAQWVATWPSPTDAVGLVADSTLPVLVAPPILDTADGGSYELDGVLQRAMVAPHWHYRGQSGAFGIFVDRRAKPPLSLRALPDGSLRGASVHRLSGPALEPRAALVSSPRGVDVVRADAAVPGWTASWTPLQRRGRAHSAPEALTVHRLGVVEVVRVPAGRGVLSWRYIPPGLVTGGSLSAASVVLLGALLVTAAGIDRARHGRRPRAPEGSFVQ